MTRLDWLGTLRTAGSFQEDTLSRLFRPRTPGTLPGMKLTDEDIREFTEIWSREFGEVLAPDQARHEATQLLELYFLLAQPLPTPESKVDASPKESDQEHQTQ